MTRTSKAGINPNVTLRKLRARAKDQPDEPWSALFLDLDAWLSAGKPFPTDWQ